MLEQEQNNNAGSIFLIRKESLFVFAIFCILFFQNIPLVKELLSPKN